MKVLVFLTLATVANGQFGNYFGYPPYGNSRLNMQAQFAAPSTQYVPPLELELGCGQTRELFPATRVVGGRKAMDGEFPWQVAIDYQKGEGEMKQFCGGVLVNQEWVLTAAHCVQGMNQTKLELELGSNDLEDEQMTTVKFEDIIIHEDYDNKTMRNDIALIKTRAISLDVLSTDVDINIICLPTKRDYFTRRAKVTGYGFLEEAGVSTNEMRVTDVILLPDSQCAESYDSFDPTIMLCAGWPDGGRDACQGDSGGPLIQKQPFTDSSVLVGIVSFGKGCARQDLPGVYTRVSAYQDWINDRIY